MEKHCIDKAIPKVSSKSMASTRNRTFVYLYFLPQPDDNMQKIRVCKKFLAATLGITERILSGFVYRFVGSAGLDLDDGEWSPAAGYEGCSREQIFLLREFIQGLPALPVHYCRNEQCTRKLYELPASIPDVSTLYGMYSSAEESLQREPVDESVFRAVLHQDYNLGFSSNSRGDVCNVREYRKAKK
ncbi:hypothetical protein BIW11_08936 [Tropilaelaps mercedesae]|uniref:Uncharacterized protein n=1 Tax=Tropilaelaps mercedesae TaxID=418985 RepID=A0A1V9XM98_9ACAR|nr:hypothetical protein BIW11_08936 [Tropilaelaps mercedesae]